MTKPLLAALLLLPLSVWSEEYVCNVDKKRDLSAKLDRLWLRFVVPVGLLGLGIYLILPNGN